MAIFLSWSGQVEFLLRHQVPHVNPEVSRTSDLRACSLHVFSFSDVAGWNGGLSSVKVTLRVFCPEDVEQPLESVVTTTLLLPEGSSDARREGYDQPSFAFRGLCGTFGHLGFFSSKQSQKGVLFKCRAKD